VEIDHVLRQLEARLAAGAGVTVEVVPVADRVELLSLVTGVLEGRRDPNEFGVRGLELLRAMIDAAADPPARGKGTGSRR
jgi:hypothetical protein